MIKSLVKDMKYSYEEAVKIIEEKGKFGSLSGCELSAVMLQTLGNPQEKLPFIHVAGTNGKGSVSAFLCAILKEIGYKVGMFTSPHLADVRERIQINRELIRKEDFRRWANFLLEQEFGVVPAMSDYYLLMALLYFKEEKCDVVILETGLGGRLDSTNAVGVPIVSVITKIGFDHTAILGNTLAKIAGEKAGILKKGSCFISESQETEVEIVLRQAAKEAQVSSIQFIDENEIQIKDGKTFSFAGYENLEMKMLGLHQFENAAAAILAAKAFLKERQEYFEESQFELAVRTGIAKAEWAGRMQILQTEPFFMVDGAHNHHGIAALCRSLKGLFPEEKFHFLMGVMADKDYEEMIQELLPLALDITTVTVGYGSSVEAKQLADCIAKYGIEAKSKEGIKEALAEISKERKEKTIALGSLYFIREMMMELFL